MYKSDSKVVYKESIQGGLMTVSDCLRSSVDVSEAQANDATGTDKLHDKSSGASWQTELLPPAPKKRQHATSAKQPKNKTKVSKYNNNDKDDERH